MDLASEESERLTCLLTLLDLGADVNAMDKHGKYTLAGLIGVSATDFFILRIDWFALCFNRKNSFAPCVREQRRTHCA